MVYLPQVPVTSANTSDAVQRQRERKKRGEGGRKGLDLASDVDMGNVSSDTRSTADIIEAE